MAAYKCFHCNEIHIGKDSAGWKFNFNYNGGKFYSNFNELLDWLKDKIIVDEYCTF